MRESFLEQGTLADAPNRYPNGKISTVGVKCPNKPRPWSSLKRLTTLRPVSPDLEFPPAPRLLRLLHILADRRRCNLRRDMRPGWEPTRADPSSTLTVQRRPGFRIHPRMATLYRATPLPRQCMASLVPTRHRTATTPDLREGEGEGGHSLCTSSPLRRSRRSSHRPRRHCHRRPRPRRRPRPCRRLSLIFRSHADQ